jgi:hypothetical protein
MVMWDVVVGVGDAECLRLHVEQSGGEGADAHAMHVWRVDPEEHLHCDLRSGWVGSLSGGADSHNMDKAAIVERDIVCKPGVISSGAVGGELSTGGGTGIGVSGE